MKEAVSLPATDTQPLPSGAGSGGARLDLEWGSSLPEASLILIAHPDERMLGSRFRLSPGSAIRIGRSLSAEVSLPEVLSVSRHHARLSYLPEGVVVEDLDSTNGVRVDDRRIPRAEVLRSGARIQVGAVHFKLLLEKDVEHAYHAAVYELMMRDGLTDLYNRRKFEEEVEREFARASRYRRGLALILFDIDHFKDVNDRYGHLAGDAVLKRVAAGVSGHVRTEQVLARVGGEEFALLCPEVDADGARVLSERLRLAVARQPHGEAGNAFTITCSFGVAGLGAGMRLPSDLYAHADRALYVSKSAGRNRVTVQAGTA
jgi:diguanylate cyclase (GGDEF)-like protein